MPSAPIDLGKYVTLRRRQDGTARVFFQVPERHRPLDWPSLIPLPRGHGRKGDLSDGREVAAIQADAKALYAELINQRNGGAKPEGRTFKVLIRRYQESDAWTNLKPKTQKVYTSYLNHIEAWEATSTPRPDPSTINQADVEGLLGLFSDKPVTKKHTRKAMRLLMIRARDRLARGQSLRRHPAKDTQVSRRDLGTG